MEKDKVPLHAVRKGRLVKVVNVPEGKNKALLIRLGVVEGVILRCLERLPGGTIVVQKQRQEIAIGAPLARLIFVSHIQKKDV